MIRMAMRHAMACVFLALVLPIASGNVMADEFAGPLQFTQWTRNDGLPINSIADIAQTRDGFLWISTRSGLVRFDGREFKVLGRNALPDLESDVFTELEVDKDGRLWAASMTGGLYFKDGRRWRKAVVPSDYGDMLIVSLLAGVDGTIWAGTNLGLATVQREGDVYVLRPISSRDPRTVTFLGVTDPHTLWYVQRGAHLLKHEVGPKPAGQTNASTIPVPERFSRIWQIGTRVAVLDWKSGIHLIGAETPEEIIRFDKVPNVSQVFVDRRNMVWIATLNAGLLVIAPNGERTDISSQFEALRSPILRVFETADGSIWIGTDGQGLIRIRRPDVEFFRKANGKDLRYVNAIAQSPDGSIFAATAFGLTKYSPTLNAFEFSKETALSKEMLALGKYAGSQFAVAAGSGTLLDVATAMPIKIDQSSMKRKRNVLSLLSAKDGATYAASTHGALVIRDGVASNLETGDVGSMSISLCEGEDGQIWVGSIDGLRLLRNGAFVDHPYSTALSGKWISGILCGATDNLWIATYGDGLFRVERGALRRFHEGNGFPKNALNGIVRDRVGNFWFPTNTGIFRILKNDILDRRDDRSDPIPAMLFDERRGLGGPETSGGQEPTSILAADGSLWFATAEGVARIAPASQSGIYPAPDIVLDDIHADGVPVAHRNDRVLFGKGTRRIEFDLSTPEFVDAKSIRLRYTIEGFDRTWFVLENERKVRASNLPPGKYVLKVVSSNAEGRWNGREKRIPFEIEPYFHQTAWFKWMALVAIIAALYALHRARLSLLKAKYAVMEERTRIAAELHDGIAQGFSGIALQMEAALAGGENPEKLQKRITNARELAISSMHELRESIRLLSPHSAKGRNVIDCVRSAISGIQDATDRNIAIEHTGVPVELPAYVLHHLDRIVRQTVWNAVEHADAAEIRVSIAFHPATVVVIVADDGNGYAAKPGAASDHPRGFGSISLQKRAALIGARLSTRSEIGAGTTVKLILYPKGLRGFFGRILAPG